MIFQFDLLRNIAPAAQLPNITSVSDVFGIVMNVLMGASFAIALGSMGYSGIQYALSMADPKATAQAWNTFIWGIIAACFSIGFLGIKIALVSLTGISDTNITNAVPGSF